ncbi:hypothetical protein BU26DRAFT_278294 [Trematosphaeria pertusa]|uniref:Uncharacterized protein n=1 Tax=Trematosphaeria pertusa TaxID=390896 RepID=A0A6A6IKP7_9PLEO|nr:uncharacterized protein BU26DRAFT_278294 [Trematosphaeria pertusa]KAF2251195.1 hypothetical protein BU26DRAFT_278294 [Trematosphaeria pertusa]
MVARTRPGCSHRCRDRHGPPQRPGVASRPKPTAYHAPHCHRFQTLCLQFAVPLSCAACAPQWAQKGTMLPLQSICGCRRWSSVCRSVACRCFVLPTRAKGRGLASSPTTSVGAMTRSRCARSFPTDWPERPSHLSARWRLARVAREQPNADQEPVRFEPDPCLQTCGTTTYVKCAGSRSSCRVENSSKPRSFTPLSAHYSARNVRWSVGEAHFPILRAVELSAASREV